MDSGSNTTTIPSKGEFTIKPESYEIAGAWPEKVIGGYTASWGADWNHKITSIDNMGENGYNIALLAFGKVINTSVGMFDDATICASGYTWDYDYTKKDAPLVIMSFGGITHENTWAPDLSSDQSINTIAAKTVAFAAENHINGVDFDLEGASTGISDADVVLVDGVQTYPKITKLITAIREATNKQADKFPRGFFITAAPQTDGNDLYWDVSGNKKFDSMLKADACGGHECFDSIFVQNYNSAKMNPNTAHDIVTRLLTAGKNPKTKFVMSYDLASGEWANNYPVIGWGSETNGSDAPIVSATKFAKEHQNIGAFV
nr:glycosyl hydrolase family 18 protein [Francisella orientalis]